jgi:hypothetical protein
MQKIILISAQIALSLYATAVNAQPKTQELKPVYKSTYSLNSILVKEEKSPKTNDLNSGISARSSLGLNLGTTNPLFTPDPTAKYQSNWGNIGDNYNNPNVPYFLRSLFNKR